MSPRLDGIASDPVSGGDPPVGGTPVSVGSAAVCVLGVATAALATPVGAGAVVGGGLAVAAVGLAGTVYGLGTPSSPVENSIAVGGVAGAVLSVAGATLAGPGAPAGGVWVLAYFAGLAFAVVGGVLLPARQRRPPTGSGSDRSSDGGGGRDRRGRPTVSIEPSGDGDWGWRITGSDGTVLASAPRRYDSASDAERAAHALADALDGTDPRTMTDPGGGFAVDTGVDTSSPASRDGRPDARDREERDETADGDDGPGSPRAVDGVVGTSAETAEFVLGPEGSDWGWQLRYEGETVIAEAPETYRTRAGARSAVEWVRAKAPDAGVLTYDPGAFEVYRRDDDDRQWHWRLRHDGEVIAVSVSGYGTRRDAMTVVQGVLEAVDDDPAVRRVDGGFAWSLAVEDEPVARSPGRFETEAAARSAFDRVREAVDGAGVLELDPAGFGVEGRAGDTWNWRLRRADGTVMATGPGHTNRDRATEGLRTVQRVVPHADIDVDDRDTARMIEEALSDAAEARSMAERIGRRDRQDDAEDGDEGDADDQGVSETDPDPADGQPPSQGSDPSSDSGTDRPGRAERDAGEQAASTDDDPGEAVRFEVIAFDGPESTHTSGSERTSGGGSDPGPGETAGDSDRSGWGWRLVRDGTVVATVARFPDGVSATDDADRVAGELVDARVVRVAPAALEMYRGEEWHWRLVTADGVVATATEGFERARDARRAAARVLETAAGQDGDLEVYRGEGWRWRFRDEDGVVAVGPADFRTPSAARDAAERLRTYGDDYSAAELSGAVVEVSPSGEDRSAWTWRLRGRDGRVLVESVRSYGTASEAETAVESLSEGLGATSDPIVRDGPQGSDADPE